LACHTWPKLLPKRKKFVGKEMCRGLRTLIHEHGNQAYSIKGKKERNKNLFQLLHYYNSNQRIYTVLLKSKYSVPAGPFIRWAHNCAKQLIKVFCT
jgi:L-rhamnose mutarotase